jgi:hypothetical protein
MSGARATQWAAAGQAESTMAKTATAEPATRATLRRNVGTAGGGFRCREAPPARAGDGLWYRADVRDTIEPPVGARERAQLSPRRWPGTSIASGADATRFTATGSRGPARWVLLMHQAATTRTYQAAGTTQEAQVTTPCNLSRSVSPEACRTPGTRPSQLLRRSLAARRDCGVRFHTVLGPTFQLLRRIWP